jgi:hypothetical protein
MLIGASTAMAQTDTATTSSTTTQTTTAQPATGATTTTTTTTTAAADDRNEVVCKRMDPPTGTRLGSRQICKTNAQWDAMHQEVRHDVGNYQSNHTQIGAPGH